MAAARSPARTDPANNQFFLLSQCCDNKNYARLTIMQSLPSEVRASAVVRVHRFA